MSGLNKAQIIGNVGNIELKELQSGGLIANVSIATSEKWTDKQSGQVTERTEWHRCVFFGKLAELVQKYVSKGNKLYVEGSLRTEKYDKDGVTHYTTKVIAKEIQFLTAKAESANGGGETQADKKAAQAYANKDQEFRDDTIPF